MSCGVVMPDGLVQSVDQEHLGCPVVTKDRAVSFPRGVAATLQWEIRSSAGQVADLSALLGSVTVGTTSTTLAPGSLAQVVFRFRQAGCGSGEIVQVVGYSWDAECGLVRVDLPSTIYDVPGIWQFDVAVSDDEGYVKIIDHGLLSVERSMFVSTDVTSVLMGPLTLGEIRLQLRDSAIENDLLAEVEFDDAELLHAMLQPINEWNETPPTVALFSASNFPFRYHWLQATVANLLLTASHWYRRNKLQIQTKGGVSDDSKNRDNPYLQTAMLLRQDWREFMQRKKLEINLRLASGSTFSSYQSWW